MKNTKSRIVIGVIGVLALMAATMGTAFAAPAQPAIVVVADGASLSEVLSDYRVAPTHVYRHALEGFAAPLSRETVREMRTDSRIASIEADQRVSIAAQEIPTGIERIFADDNAKIDIDGSDDFRVDVDVAVIDTGIDYDHLDLNVVARTDCANGGPFGGDCKDGEGDDGNGHGTHVAGTIAAIDNGSGVVGVAPGARLWAVRVLDNSGSGWMSWIVGGVDWVTANSEHIEVANMSLGCECSSDALDKAIASSVGAGVVYAVAAGNSDKDASSFSPANHPDVITVSALADFDGEPGALADPTCRTDEDDTLANFSNFGELIEIAAPGVCILSTWKDGGYNTISGTSMASPHTAGAAALLASVNNPANKTDVEAIGQTLEDEGNSNWKDDSGDGIKEPLLDVGNSSTFDPKLVAVSGGDGGTTNSPPTAGFTYSCTDLTCDFDGSGSSDSDGTVESYDWEFGDGNTASGVTVNHTYASGGEYTVTLTVTDDGGATDSDSQTVSVSEGSSDSGETADGMHVGDLDGTSSNGGPTWTANVSVLIHDADGNAVSHATVSFSYLSERGEVSGTTSCDTGSDGTCTVSVSGIAKRDGTITFEVTGVSHLDHIYSSTDNHDPDADSNGTWITVSKP